MGKRDKSLSNRASKKKDCDLKEEVEEFVEDLVSKNTPKKKKRKKKRKSSKKDSTESLQLKASLAQLKDENAFNEQKEASLRSLDFHSEVQHVVNGLRDFVPDINVTPVEFKSQEALLDQAEANESEDAKLDIEFHQKRLQRPVRELKENSSLQVQRLWRGYAVRKQLFDLHEKKQQEKDCKRVEEEHVNGAWRLVHDPDTEDTWYYNDITGVSQWNVPEVFGALKKVETPEEDIANPEQMFEQSSRSPRDQLPPLSHRSKGSPLRIVEGIEDKDGIPYCKSSMYPSSDRSVSTTSNTTASDDVLSIQSDATMQSTQQQQQQQRCEADTPKFFLPDGSTDVNLRETIRAALNQVSYNSCSFNQHAI